MKKLLLSFIFITSCLEKTHEEWKAECDNHPYYEYTSDTDVRKIEANGGVIGGRYFGGTGQHSHAVCSPRELNVLWNDSDPKVQYTINALKEITGGETKKDIFKYFKDIKIIDLREYKEIYDLRPLHGLTFYTEEIYLPKGVEVNTLWGLKEKTTEYNKLKVLDAPDVKVTGTRPEDCPREDQVDTSWAIEIALYSPAVVNFCKNQPSHPAKKRSIPQLLWGSGRRYF